MIDCLPLNITSSNGGFYFTDTEQSYHRRQAYHSGDVINGPQLVDLSTITLTCENAASPRPRVAPLLFAALLTHLMEQMAVRTS